MKRKGSYLAHNILKDYKREQYMKKKAERQKCKEKECLYCKWNTICEDKEEREVLN